MKKHFVLFYSPGTFVSETTEKEIDSWDVEKAKKLARTIKERHNASPYGFCFITRERRDDELDSKVTKTSNTYFLGGKVLTLNDILAKDDPNDRILISNMQNNGWDRVIENTNSWKVTLPLKSDDIILEW